MSDARKIEAIRKSLNESPDRKGNDDLRWALRILEARQLKAYDKAALHYFGTGAEAID